MNSDTALDQSSACVFVMGSPRSGTSVLAWSIAQHEEMWTGPEADFPYFLCKHGSVDRTWELAVSRPDGWLARNEVDRSEYLSWIGLGVDRMFLSRSEGRRWVDSTPASVLVAPDLARMFPQARFLNVIRDGRAVVNSLIRSGFDIAAARDFGEACKTWSHFVKKGLEFQDEMPDRVLEVRHERLTADPETVMDEVQRFLGLEPVAEPAAFLRKNRINSSYGNSKPGDVKKSKPLSLMPQTPWKDWGRRDKRRFRTIGEETMIRLGYPPGLD